MANCSARAAWPRSGPFAPDLKHTQSRDGTRIAYERHGDGPPLILVSAALQGRGMYRSLAEELGRHMTVVNYDRRGRGDSDDGEYTVERELDDLAALIAALGGTASLYGHSSGAGLVMHAAARGLPVARIVLHEPPFGTDSDEERQADQKLADEIAALLAADRRADAIKAFIAPMGLPAEVVEQFSQDPATQANAPTILHDPFVVMDKASRGARTPAEQAAAIAVPGLVLIGGDSPQWMTEAGERIAGALNDGRALVLEGQGHFAPPEVLTPVLVEFLLSGR